MFVNIEHDNANTNWGWRDGGKQPIVDPRPQQFDGTRRIEDEPRHDRDDATRARERGGALSGQRHRYQASVEARLWDRGSLDGTERAGRPRSQTDAPYQSTAALFLVRISGLSKPREQSAVTEQPIAGALQRARLFEPA